MRLKDVPKTHVAKFLGVTNSKPQMGTDPEFFVVGTRNKILASDKFFPGKEKPLKFRAGGGNSTMSLFFDGIQAEINVPANGCRESVAYYLRLALKRANTEILKKGKQYKIIMRPSVRVSQKVLDDADPEARRFGCMPDFNAYTGTQNTPEMDASKHPYRYAGGHIHIGVSSNYLSEGSPEHTIAKTEEGHIKIIKLIDYLCGLMMVLMDRGPAAKRRRTKYGNAGCFRPTPYGIEYRTPSCWWLKSPIGQSLAFGMARMAWNLCQSQLEDEFLKHTGYDEETVKGVLDEGDIQKAKALWKKMRPYVAVVSTRNHNPVNILSLKNGRNGYPSENRTSDIMSRVANGNAPKVLPADSDTVFTLAAVEWMIKNGPDVLVTDNIIREWNLAGKNASFNGIVSGAWYKLKSDEEFMKFQKDFYKNII